jgi:hypothetical protein
MTLMTPSMADDHLDAIHQVERDAGALIEASGAIQRVVDGMAIDQQEHVLAVVLRQQHTA